MFYQTILLFLQFLMRYISFIDLDPIEAYKVQKNCDEVCSLKKAFDSSGRHI